MKRIFLLSSLLILLLSGCNGERFVDPMETDKTEVELTLERPRETVSISGKWNEIWLYTLGAEYAGIKVYDKDGNLKDTDGLPVLDGPGSIVVENDVQKFTVTRTSSNTVTLELGYLLGKSPVDYVLTMSGTILTTEVSVRLRPTHPLTVKSVDYTLDSWGEYPSYAYDKLLISMTYPPAHGVPYMKWEYPGVGQIGSITKFEPYDHYELAQAMAEQGDVWLEVPSSTGEYHPWEMAGDETIYSLSFRNMDFRHFPPHPGYATVPGEVSVTLELWCKFTRNTFSCRITVPNPATGKDVIINGKLEAEMPAKLYGNYEVLQ